MAPVVSAQPIAFRKFTALDHRVAGRANAAFQVLDKAVDPGDTTLTELLAGKDISVRLAKMLANTTLGEMTFRKFTQSRDDVIAWMLQQQNCGRRTVGELATLIDTYPLLRLEPEEPKPVPQLDDVELGRLLAADGLSNRLGNILRTTELRTTKLSAYVRAQGDFEALMLRLPNCGRKSVSELRRLVGAHIQQQIALQNLDAGAFGPNIVMLVEAAGKAAPKLVGPPPGCDLRTLVEWHLARLPARTSDVIALRFGLNSNPAMTLAEIGEVYYVTRERIRQIEAKGLKAMLTACRRFSVRPLVDEATPALLESIFGQDRHATSSKVEHALTAINGWLKLALWMARGSSQAWFDRNAKRLGRGWVLPGTDPAELEAIAGELRRRARERPLPRAALAFCDGLDLPLATAAIELLLELRVKDGYVFQRRPGPRLQRTALLHAVLAREEESLEIVPLLRRYHEEVARDLCSDRDLVIVMEAAPHLFLEIHEGCWTTIGRAAPLQRDNRNETLEDDRQQARRDDEEGTIAEALETELARIGPSRLGELMSRAIDILPEGRSRNSVGPTLLLNPTRFVRVLPGVYALPNQVMDGRGLVHAGAVEYLLNTTQAHFYAIGRKAGERWGAFPLWTPTAEMRLCRWARAGDDSALYRSLLDISSIDKWPTDESDKETWRELRMRYGRFELWSARRAPCGPAPIDRVLAAALRLRQQGSIGWITGNRILGYRPNASAGAGMLAGMVNAGMAIEPVGEFGWQLPHRPGPRLAEWLERLTNELHDYGEIKWGAGTGLELVTAFVTGASGTATQNDPVDEFDEYESIMAEHRRSLEARRIEARLELAAG